MDGAAPISRHGLLGRFDASTTEADYRHWHALRMRSTGTAMALASIAIWVLAAPTVQLLLEVDHLVLVYAICWGVNVPVLLGGALYMRRPDPRHAVWVGMVLLAVTAVDTITVIMPAIHDLDATAYALMAVFFGMVGPLTQLPFRLALAVGVVITAAGEIGTLTATGGSHASVALAAVVVPLSTLVVGGAMAFAVEIAHRSRYVDEHTIAQQRKLIRRYAPGSVVSRIEHGDTTVDEPQRRKVTVFFSDVVGFTTLADRIDPEALAEIVNAYLGALAELVERHGGTLNEFAGDGVMALFGAPDELDPHDQVLSAIDAARELQASLPEWSRAWYQHGIVEDLKSRVGINTGIVSVGTFGSAVRATYTGIGLQTNIAARVQAEAPPGGILISNTSWHLVKDDVACIPRGEVMVKGVHFPIELYEPAR